MITLYTHKAAEIKKTLYKHLLKMWRDRRPHILLVGVHGEGWNAVPPKVKHIGFVYNSAMCLGLYTYIYTREN